MDDNFDDTYDYLSQLRSGSNGSLPRSCSVFSGSSTHNSDIDSDNDCIIIEVNKQTKDETESESKDSRPTIQSIPEEPKSTPRDLKPQYFRV